MRRQSVYTRTLVRAIEVAGDVETLARFLGCKPGEFGRWETGETNPPMPIFLAMVDIVAANSLTPVALENLPAARARLSSALRRPAANQF
jgi:hypothetical protein